MRQQATRSPDIFRPATMIRRLRAPNSYALPLLHKDFCYKLTYCLNNAHPQQESSQSTQQSRSPQPPHPQTLPLLSHAPAVETPNPSATGSFVNWLEFSRNERPQRPMASSVCVPVIPTREIAYTNPCEFSAIAFSRSSGEVGAARNTGARSFSCITLKYSAASSTIMSVKQHTIRTRVLRGLCKCFHPQPHHGVQIAEQNNPRRRPRIARISLDRSPAHRVSRVPRATARSRRPLNHRPIRQRIAERHTQLNHIRTVIDGRNRHITRCYVRSGSPAVK